MVAQYTIWKAMRKRSKNKTQARVCVSLQKGGRGGRKEERHTRGDQRSGQTQREECAGSTPSYIILTFELGKEFTHTKNELKVSEAVPQ